MQIHMQTHIITHANTHANMYANMYASTYANTHARANTHACVRDTCAHMPPQTTDAGARPTHCLRARPPTRMNEARTHAHTHVLRVAGAGGSGGDEVATVLRQALVIDERPTAMPV